jgi:hypothetical protein
MNDGHKSLPPWHMWGSSETFNISTTGPSGFNLFQKQLARVDYGRPESWGFILAAELGSVLTGDVNLTAEFDFKLVVGIGRSTATLVVPRILILANPALGNRTFFCTQFLSPKFEAVGATPDPYDSFVRDFCAQSINASVSVFLNANIASSASITATAMFAPKNHIRPEWYQGKFPGNETIGT